MRTLLIMRIPGCVGDSILKGGRVGKLVCVSGEVTLETSLHTQ